MIPNQIQKQLYWNCVSEAFRIVNSSEYVVENLRSQIERLPERKQELFYHAEPLDVAKDLSGIYKWTEEQLNKYREISNTLRASTPVPLKAGSVGWLQRYRHTVFFQLAMASMTTQILVYYSHKVRTLVPVSFLEVFVVLATLFQLIILFVYWRIDIRSKVKQEKTKR